MNIRDAAEQLIAHYPRIFFACHTRHVRDPRTKRVLSEHQAQILDHLDEKEAISLMDLAGHMGVTAGTMSLAIERLVRKGYVIRARDRNDKRRLNLRLAPAGARVKEAHSVLDARRVEELVARLKPEEREAGIRGLGLLAAAAQECIRERAPAARASRGSRRRA